MTTERLSINIALLSTERVRAEKIYVDDFVDEFDSRHDSRRNPLTPVPVTMMGGAFLAITRQPLKLERCSNPLRIREDF